MNYAYIRVSTDKQTVENQKMEIKKYCKQKGFTKIVYISEIISGKKDFKKRKLGMLLEELKENDRLIITELSRLGRSLIMIFQILDILMNKKVSVFAIKENYELGNNIQSQVLAFAFGLSAQIERDLISERTKMGLERARKEGKQIGRRKGQKSSHYKLTNKKSYIIKGLKNGKSISSLAKELNVTWTTLKNYMKANKII